MSEPSRAEALAAAYEAARPELTAYLTRLVLREDVAEEIAQQAAVRMLEAENVPSTASELRAWLFRVATNLGIDHRRRHATRHESVLGECRKRAENTPSFIESSRALHGSPETRSIAVEHLTVCFACTLQNVGPEQSAALLMKEVYGFTVEEVADAMGATFGQAKGWIQSARARLTAIYSESCALVARKGACHQCVELDRFFGAGAGDPLQHSARDVDARLDLVRERRSAPLGRWHKEMMRLIVDSI
ncbi:MAG TPA: RNA polymerase sigma factor [Candidatus Limnocylindrales bacterium]|nr:RNA polymerase sigma factor [Candidatus Limnocylindrales bacterium]